MPDQVTITPTATELHVTAVKILAETLAADGVRRMEIDRVLRAAVERGLVKLVGTTEPAAPLAAVNAIAGMQVHLVSPEDRATKVTVELGPGPAIAVLMRLRKAGFLLAEAAPE